MAIFKISCDVIKEHISKKVNASDEKEAREKFKEEVGKEYGELDNFEVEKIN